MTETATYRIVPSASQVTFLGESSVHPIEATVAPQGWLTAHVSPEGLAGNTASGRIEIPVADLSSGNPLIDRETKRRTDAKQFPTIVGDLTEVLSIEGTTADIEGRIVFRGAAVDVEGRIELSTIEPGRIVVEGEGEFDVRWWGLEPPKLLMLKVHPEVTVRVRLVMEAE